MIELGQLRDGRLIVASNEPFPADVKRVEYYREQRLFLLVYEDDSEYADDLMPCEITPELTARIHASPDIMVIAMAGEGHEPYGYPVPLVQVGV